MIYNKLLYIIAEQQIFTFYNIIGWILNSIVCILLTVFIYPYLDNWFQEVTVRCLSWLPFSSKHKLSGRWTHCWHVASDSFPELNEVKEVEIKQFRNWIWSKYQVVDKKGKLYDYQIWGRIKNDMTVTGTWRDMKSGNRYYGCFQLYIDFNENKMSGFWTGVSNSEKIKSGRWEWTREDADL